ncbi:MAG: AraC family chitin signaling transcriptional activator, partial [Saprospiraceae bacterium]
MNSLQKKITSFLFFYSLLVGFLPAQEVPKVIQFQKSDYNAGDQNWMITQDCDGYLYVANTKGVLLFNGFSWQQISL